jgi:hypothetical protein
VGFSTETIVPDAASVKLCALFEGACVALATTRSSSVDTYSQPLLDALDHLCHQVDGDPKIEQEFYDADTPEEMVDLAVATGIFIDADDFRALLRSGSTECWVVRGEDNDNPIVHLQRVFRV